MSGPSRKPNSGPANCASESSMNKKQWPVSGFAEALEKVGSKNTQTQSPRCSRNSALVLNVVADHSQAHRSRELTTRPLFQNRGAWPGLPQLNVVFVVG